MPDLFVAQKQTKNKEESAAPEILNTPAGQSPQARSLLGGAPQKSVPISGAEHNPHMFSSYCEDPNSITFADAEPDEEILLFLRRHFITNLPWIIIFGLLLVAPIFFSFIFNAFKIDLAFLPNHSVIFLSLFYYLLVFAYMLVSFFTWFFNISLITQRRIVDIDFSDLVYKNVAATKLDLIQDASYSQIGVIRSVFDYGDVLIQTAGALDNFDFQAVPHPERVIQIVENLIGKDNKSV